MVNRVAFETVVKLIENTIIKHKNEVQHVLKKELIDSGKMTNVEVGKILALENIQDLNMNVMIWVYSALKKYNENFPKLTDLFTEIEIKNSEEFNIKRCQSSYPITFKYTKLSDKNEYKLTLSIQEIYSLMKSGNIVLIEGMQRESEYTMYGDELVSHVAYSDNVAREIAQKMLLGDYWSKDDISWHLIDEVNNGAEFSVIEEDNEIVIKKGTIALLDGQHRIAAIGYALMQNPNLNIHMGVYLTIGATEMGQNIIAQSELRQPIDRRVVKAYTKSAANDIFKMFYEDKKISRRFKFVDTLEAENNEIGFGVKSDIIKAIEQYYKVDEMTVLEQEDLAAWLVEFYVELYNHFEKDIINFKSTRKYRWTTKTNAFYLYTALSSVLFQKSDWKLTLPKILNNIDFSAKNLVYRNLANKQTVKGLLNMR